MEKREKCSKHLKRVLVSLLFLTLVATTAISQPGEAQAHTAYAATNEETQEDSSPIVLKAALQPIDDPTTERVQFTISMENQQGLQVSGIQFMVSFPEAFTLIESKTGTFFGNGDVSSFGETGANPYSCSFGSHGDDDGDGNGTHIEYVTTKSGELITFIFEANRLLNTTENYQFKVYAGDDRANTAPKAFLLLGAVGTEYDVNISKTQQTYRRAADAETITTDTDGKKSTITPKQTGTGSAAVKQQIIAEAVKNSEEAIIDMSNVPATEDQTTKLEISKAAMGIVADKEKSLTVQTKAGSLNFSPQAAKGISDTKDDGRKLAISVKKQDTITYTPTGGSEKTADAVNFEVTATLHNDADTAPTEIKNFGGEVSVALPLPQALQNAGQEIKCWYYNLKTKNYVPITNGRVVDNNGTKQFVFTTTHFSHYMATTEDIFTEYADANGITEGVTVSGTAISWDNADNAQYLLYQDTVSDEDIKADIKLDAPTKALSTATRGGTITKNTDGKRFDQTFRFESVANGTYKLAIYKKGKYVPKILSITVTSEGVTEDISEIKLWLYGDVNYDGKVDTTDGTAIYRKYAGKTSVFDSALDFDRLAASDVNEDGSIDTTDGTAIYRKYAGKSSVFDTIK